MGVARISVSATGAWTEISVIYMDRKVGPIGHSWSHHIIVEPSTISHGHT